MPIILEPLPQTTRRSTLTAGVSTVDGCPVLTRLRAFVSDQGSAVALKHYFLDRRTGSPLDLSQFFDLPDSESDSSSVSSSVTLRIKEELGAGDAASRNPLWEADGTVTDPVNGEVVVDVPTAVTDRAGVYRLSWGVKDAATGDVVLQSSGLLSVERSLFGDTDYVLQDMGPITLQTLRVYLRDSHPNENLRLDDVEFGDEEILAAMLRPIQYYNDQPPPLRPHATTRDFPSRYNWSQAVISVLYEMAAGWYRRNKQQIQTGGLSDDDLNRDRDYEAKSQQLWQAYKEWVFQDKVSRNARLVTGAVRSVYGKW